MLDRFECLCRGLQVLAIATLLSSGTASAASEVQLTTAQAQLLGVAVAQAQAVATLPLDRLPAQIAVPPTSPRF